MKLLSVILSSIFNCIALIILTVIFGVFILFTAGPILILTIPFYILAFLIYLICQIFGIKDLEKSKEKGKNE